MILFELNINIYLTPLVFGTNCLLVGMGTSLLIVIPPIDDGDLSARVVVWRVFVVLDVFIGTCCCWLFNNLLAESIAELRLINIVLCVGFNGVNVMGGGIGGGWLINTCCFSKLELCKFKLCWVRLDDDIKLLLLQLILYIWCKLCGNDAIADVVLWRGGNGGGLQSRGGNNGASGACFNCWGELISDTELSRRRNLGGNGGGVLGVVAKLFISFGLDGGGIIFVSWW